MSSLSGNDDKQADAEICALFETNVTIDDSLIVISRQNSVFPTRRAKFIRREHKSSSLSPSQQVVSPTLSKKRISRNEDVIVLDEQPKQKQVCTISS